MVKRITISLSEWVYDQYIGHFAGNKSKYIEELIVKGFESEIGEKENIKMKLMTLLKELKNKDDIISAYEKLIGTLKNRINNKVEKTDEQIREENLKEIKFNTLKANMHKIG